MRYFIFALLLITMILSCSGGNSGTTPEFTPRISSSHSNLAFTVAAGALVLPDPVSLMFTNNTEDTLACNLTNTNDWLLLGGDSLYLLPHESQPVTVSVDITDLTAKLYRDTVYMWNCADSSRLRSIPANLTVIVNNTYLTTSDPDMSYDYLGQDGDCHVFLVNCTWKMICHSNGDNAVHVFKYEAIW